MSRNSLIRPRRPRAVSDRPAPATRLLPTPYPLTLPPNPYYQRYVEAERLRLGSDHPLFLSQYCLTPVSDDGRFLDSTRQALLQGNHCRDNAPRTGRVYVAGIDLAGESEQPAIGGTRAIEPSRDSTVVTIGELRSLDDGLGSKLPSISVVEHYWWTGKPHTEIFSTLVHILKNVWGCRRVVVDATGVGAGVAAFLRKSPGPSIPSPSAPSPVGTTGWSPWGGVPSPNTHERDRLLAHTPIISHAHPFPSSGAPFPRKAENICPEQSNRHGFN